MRVDSELYDHLNRDGVDILQFTFRWVNCLFLRELPSKLIPRLMDTYLAEGDDLSIFIEYFCLVVLLKWSEQVRWVLQVLDKNMITTQSLTVERYEVSKYHDIHSESTD